jgi:hypothetical protein
MFVFLNRFEKRLIGYLESVSPNFRYLADNKPDSVMEATFVLDAQEDRVQFVERLSTFFADKAIRVHVEEIQKPSLGQQHLLKQMQSLRERMAQTPVTMPAGFDINDIIDEVNGNTL